METTDIVVKPDAAIAAPPNGRHIMTQADVRNVLMPQNYSECNMLAKAFLESGMYRINNLGQAMVVLLTGMDLGVTPSVAFRSIHVIDGKPSPSADLMVGVCKQRREVCEYFRLIESTPEIATFETKRVGDPAVTMSYTVEDARLAGLIDNPKKPNWSTSRPQMLCARCSSRLARVVYQDLCLGLYIPDELTDSDVTDGEYTAAPAQAAESRPARAARAEPKPAVSFDNRNQLVHECARAFGGKKAGGERTTAFLKKLGHTASIKDMTEPQAAEVWLAIKDLPDYVEPSTPKVDPPTEGTPAPKAHETGEVVFSYQVQKQLDELPDDRDALMAMVDGIISAMDAKTQKAVGAGFAQKWPGRTVDKLDAAELKDYIRVLLSIAIMAK